MLSPRSSHESRFQAWLEEHHGIVVKLTRSFASTLADQADLQQELLLQLWISLSSYAGQAKPSTWIYRVCLNTALTWRRGILRRAANCRQPRGKLPCPRKRRSSRNQIEP